MALVAPKQAGLLPSRQSSIVPAKQIAALWDPTQLGSALAAWWDPRQGITLNGSTVSAWADRVAGLSATQSTASAQPTYSATARNGTAGLTFSGAQSLKTSSLGSMPTGSAASTMFVSGYPTKGGTTMSFFGYGNTGGGNWRVMAMVGSTNDPLLSLYANQTDGGSVWLNTDRAVAADIAPASGPVVYTDGAAAAGAHAGNTSVNTSGANAFIGSDAANEYLTGVVQHIVVTVGLLTTSQRNKLFGWESWASGKNGANLPSSHPYKSRAPYVSDP